MSNHPHWLYEPTQHRRLWVAFIVVLTLTVVAELIWPIHGHFDIESLFGFNALYGFIVCALMIAFAKLLALWLKRPDTYYDESSAHDSSEGLADTVAHTTNTSDQEQP